MNPFIPLNTTNEGNVKNLPMSGMTEDGIPVCQAGHQMYYYGHCKDRDRLKWRCPIKARHKRVFKREKNDFELCSFKTRSKERLLFYALLTAIAVHIDTWYRQDSPKSP